METLVIIIRFNSPGVSCSSQVADKKAHNLIYSNKNSIKFYQ